MRIVAVLDDGLRDESCYPSYFRKIREFADADEVVVIMSGLFLHSGMPAPDCTENRAEKLVAGGADLVVEMPLQGALLKQDSYVFAIAMLMQKMGFIDELIMPCREGTVEILEKAEQTMLLMPPEYQKELMRLRKTQDLDSAVPAALGKLLSGAEDVLRDPMNRFAVEVKSALRKSYCTTKTVFMSTQLEAELDEIPESVDAELGDMFYTLFGAMPEKWFFDIFGGTDSVVRNIKDLWAEHLSFTQLAERLAERGIPAKTARQYLLRCLLGFRNINHSTSALYSYVSSIRVVKAAAGKEALCEKLRSCADVPVVLENEADSELDAAAAKLYESIMES